MATITITLAHLLAGHQPLNALLLYGGAGVGVVCGMGLFSWGRHERQASPPPPPAEAGPAGQEPLIK